MCIKRGAAITDIEEYTAAAALYKLRTRQHSPCRNHFQCVPNQVTQMDIVASFEILYGDGLTEVPLH